MRSLCCWMMGTAYFWTGVGELYLARWMLLFRRGEKPASENFSMCWGMFSPFTTTLMSSYLAKLMPVATLFSQRSSRASSFLM